MPSQKTLKAQIEKNRLELIRQLQRRGFYGREPIDTRIIDYFNLDKADVENINYPYKAILRKFDQAAKEEQEQ